MEQTQNSKLEEIPEAAFNQRRLQLSYIMKIPIFRAVPIIVGILLSYAQACKSFQPKGWYVKVRKAEYEAKVKELEAAKAKEKELSSKLLEEREQNLVPSIIEEEEKVLEMMEDQELPYGSRYHYLPARQYD